MNVILPIKSAGSGPISPYALLADGWSINKKVAFEESYFTILFCRHALLDNQLHIFGGYYNGHKIARLERCEFRELPARLSYRYNYGHAVLAINEGSKAMVCFGFDEFNAVETCELYDGQSLTEIIAPDGGHASGELAFYNGRSTVVGGKYAYGAVERLTDDGWVLLKKHPKWIHDFSAVGLPSGSLLTIGGLDSKIGNPLDEIWRLMNNKWSVIGYLFKAVHSPSTILFDDSIIIFPGTHGEQSQSKSIQKVILDLEENIVSSNAIGGHKMAEYGFPIIYVAPVDYCTL